MTRYAAVPPAVSMRLSCAVFCFRFLFCDRTGVTIAHNNVIGSHVRFALVDVAAQEIVPPSVSLPIAPSAAAPVFKVGPTLDATGSDYLYVAHEGVVSVISLATARTVPYALIDCLFSLTALCYAVWFVRLFVCGSSVCFIGQAAGTQAALSHRVASSQLIAVSLPFLLPYAHTPASNTLSLSTSKLCLMRYVCSDGCHSCLVHRRPQ